MIKHVDKLCILIIILLVINLGLQIYSCYKKRNIFRENYCGASWNWNPPPGYCEVDNDDDCKAQGKHGNGYLKWFGDCHCECV